MKARTKIAGAVTALVLVGAVVAGLLLQDQLKRTYIYLRYGHGCRDCNVVLISIDALRADHVGAYGYHRDTTPRIDRYFADKTVFSNALTPAPCTVPAVLQLLTGVFDHQSDHPRMAEVLKKHGYATAAVVSQHMFGTREKRKSQYARGFDHFDIQSKQQLDKHNMSSRNASEVADRSIRWIEQRGGDDKFFLWAHFFDPHDPYQPSDEYRGWGDPKSQYLDGDRRARLIAAQLEDRDRSVWKEISGPFAKLRNSTWRMYGHVFEPRDVAHFVGLYDGEIRYTDYEVGRILDTLDTLNLADNTVVIVTSDHGEWLGEDNVWDHCLTLHRRELNVPLMMSVRDTRLGGLEQVEAAVSTIDIFPTLMTLLEIPTEAGTLDGQPLTALASDRTAFSVWQRKAVAQRGGWKLTYEDESKRLFHVATDPQEEEDVIEAQPEVDESLSAQLGAFLQSRANLGAKFDNIVDELKSLGYIN